MKASNILLHTDSIVTKFCKWLSIAAAVCAGIMMIIAVIDVIGFKFFDTEIPGAYQFIEELMVFMVFLAIAYLETERGHIRITILNKVLPPWGLSGIRLLGHFLGMLVIGFLSWRSFIALQYAITGHLYKYGEVEYPLWPSYAALFLGFSLLTIVYFLILAKAVFIKSKSKNVSPVASS